MYTKCVSALKATSLTLASILAVAVALQSYVVSAAPRTRAVNLRLDSDEGLKPVNAKIEPVTFRGRKALRVSDTAPEGTSDAGRYVIVTGSEFEDGVIEVDLAGYHVPSAPGSRGFVGIAFRVAPDGSRHHAPRSDQLSHTGVHKDCSCISKAHHNSQPSCTFMTTRVTSSR